MGGAGVRPQRVGVRRARKRSAIGAAVSVQIEVPFHDVDSLGIVWHGHYLKYLELARTALLRDCRLDARDLRALGFGMVMIESHCRHVAPLRYGDRAQVSAWLCDVRHRIRIGYEVVREADEACVARAETTLVSVTREGELLLETPEPILRRLEERFGAALDLGKAGRLERR